MDFRDQSSSVFSSSTSGGVDRRRENGAGTVIFSPPSLVFDHHLHRHHHHPHQKHHHHHHHHPSSPPSPKKEKQSKVTRDLDSDPKSESESEPDHDPDPVSVSIAVAGPISVKTSPRTPLISKSSGLVRYRECLKNHAASSGGHVVDGCGEFMPSGEEGSLGALKCAACNCHRNFHRKEVDDKAKCRGIISPLAQPLQFQKISLGSPGPTPFQPTTMMAFGSGGGGGGATESSSEDINLFNTNPEGSAAAARQMMMNSFGQSKKRFRTKFTQEQKEKMLEFADKIGWRFQKQDEADIQVFCSEVGIQREVLKVWMHNNKHSMKMKQQQLQQHQHQQQQQQQELQQ